MQQRRNAMAGLTGDPRGNPLTNGIVRHDSHMLKSETGTAGNRTHSRVHVRLCGVVQVLFVGVMWLLADWEVRRPHLLAIMICVRFGLVPAQHLLALRTAYRQPELRELVSHRNVQELLSDGLSYSALHSSTHGVVDIILASHLREPDSFPSGATPGFSNVRNVPDDAVSRWVFSGLSRYTLHPSGAPKSPRFTFIGSQDIDTCRVVDVWVAVVADFKGGEEEDMSGRSRNHSKKQAGDASSHSSRRKAEEGRQNFDWSRLSVPDKSDFVDYVHNMVVNFEEPDVRVVAGDLEFNCHAVVLRSYSGFFRETTAPAVVLPPAAASSAAFSALYDWMLASGEDASSVLNRDNIVDVLASARCLRVPDLARLCETLLADEALFAEYAAFCVMLDAGARHGLEDVRDAMLPRIRTCFLHIVATDDFIRLSAYEVSRLLSSDHIAVHGELETTNLPSRRSGFDSRRGLPRILACAKGVGRCHTSAESLKELLFPHPFHSGVASYFTSPTSCLKTSVLRAAKISPLPIQNQSLKAVFGPQTVQYTLSGKYAVVLECKGGVNGRSLRKPFDQRYRLARYPHAKIRDRHCWESHPVRLAGRRVVLFAGVMWLLADWEVRRPHLLAIMICVRFGLVPAQHLLALRTAYRQPELRELVSHRNVQELLSDGLSYSALHSSTQPGDQASVEEMARQLGCQPQQPRASLPTGSCPSSYREFAEAVEHVRPSATFRRLQQERRAMPLYQRPAGLPTDTSRSFVRGNPANPALDDTCPRQAYLTNCVVAFGLEAILTAEATDVQEVRQSQKNQTTQHGGDG
ncbi:hypothetical protein PR048_027802 [Dryococelus australis]|uniref:BTB domain-containing protein n=1 Tax=Dryococelus australis TaxID=614101 RepID=A0ABQ9GHI0_9NEOP|nr:hypothetical protein PR048_027802 [Dryococelus australis]